MKFGNLIAEEREFILRSLAFCGVRVVVPLSNHQGRFKLSETELADQDIQEIHLLDESYEGIRIKLEELGFVKKGNIGKWTVYINPEEVLNSEAFEGTFKTGHLVIMNTGHKGVKNGATCLVIRADEEHLSLLSHAGQIANYYIPSETTYLKDLIFIRDTFYRYGFTDMATVIADYKSGHFNLIFK